jgi:hypothetical protein
MAKNYYEDNEDIILFDRIDRIRKFQDSGKLRFIQIYFSSNDAFSDRCDLAIEGEKSEKFLHDYKVWLKYN